VIADSDISPDTVRAFYRVMCEQYGASVKPKRGDLAMEVAATFLATVQIQKSRDAFLDNYVTTLGRTVLVPFDVGVDGRWSCWQQIEVLAHECERIHQQDATSTLAHGFDYLVSKARRTRIEAEAYAVNLELHHWRYGTIEDWYPRVRAESMHGYGVSDADVAYLRRFLASRAPTIVAGGIVSHAGRTAIAWLDRNAPELRSPSVADRRLPWA
jgi:hypothetical protein